MKEGRKKGRNYVGEQDRSKYVDILFLPHPVSKKHPPMDRSVRAAQFSPFAALTGYEAAIQETRRLTDRFVELEEYERALLDQTLKRLRQCLQARSEQNNAIQSCAEQNHSRLPVITVTYFQPDARKEGGTYVEFCGPVRWIDEYKRVLVMEDGTEILLDRVTNLVETEDFEKFRACTDPKEQ
ncbi:MAG: hypothetical protein II347_04360 [Lachnospiraceae bacterium]|nr:hypothetical protein [Lachnospiraceae bacterium]